MACIVAPKPALIVSKDRTSCAMRALCFLVGSMMERESDLMDLCLRFESWMRKVKGEGKEVPHKCLPFYVRVPVMSCSL